MEAAMETNLLPGTPVVIGGGDGITAAIAGGCTSEKDAYLYYGSSAWIGLCKKKIFMDSKKRIFNWAMDDKAMVSPCGTMQAAGVSLDWMNSEVSLEERDQARAQGALVQDIIEQEILHTAVGSKGVMFLPYLSGERSPYWNPDATGAFVGIRKDTSRHDLFRACYEGVALNLKSIWNIFQPINNARQLVLLGGQSCSKFNRQLIADALGITVVTHDHVRDSKNFGSAILGGIGIGIYKNFDVVKKLLHYDSALEPNPDHVAFYNGRLPLFQYAYTCLVPFYQKMRNDEGEGHVVV
jgi:xylulokinase